MRYEDYLKEIEKNDADQKACRRKLDAKFALSNNTVKIGDLITDHIGTGRVKSIKVYRWHDCRPQCLYVCENLTKSLSVSKRQPERKICQSNLVGGE